MKRFHRYVAMLLAVLISVGLLSGCNNNAANGSNSKETTVGTLLAAVYDKILYIADTNGNIHTANFYGEALTEQTSIDGSKYMIADSDDNTLMYFDGSEIKTIARNVGVAVMSADGSAIAYIVEAEDLNNCELYRYANDESVLIGSGRLCMCAISPDGNTIGYTTCDEEGNYTSYYQNGSEESQEIGKYMGIFAISNEGKYIYYTRFENGRLEGFYVQCRADGTTRTKLADRITSETVYFNNDGTEFIYADNEKTYVSVKGKVVTEMDFVLAYVTPLFSKFMATAATSYQGPAYIYCDADTFAKSLFLLCHNFSRPYSTAKGFVYLDQNFEQTTFIETVDNVYFSESTKIAYICTCDQIGVISSTYKFDTVADNPTPTELFSGRWGTIADDGKAFYYIDNDDICYKIDGTADNAEPTQVTQYRSLYDSGTGDTVILEGAVEAIPEDVTECITFNGKIIYLHDGSFYCYDDGKIETVDGLNEWLDSHNFDEKYKIRDDEYGYIKNGSAPNFICTYGDMVVAFPTRSACSECRSGEVTLTTFAGCYYSIDGINFQPLVANYFEDHTQDEPAAGTTGSTEGPTTP